MKVGTKAKNLEEVGGEGKREETPPSLLSGFCFLFKLFIVKAMEILTMQEIGIQPYNDPTIELLWPPIFILNKTFL